MVPLVIARALDGEKAVSQGSKAPTRNAMLPERNHGPMAMRMPAMATADGDASKSSLPRPLNFTLAL